jgi:hypothetical protein
MRIKTCVVLTYFHGVLGGESDILVPLRVAGASYLNKTPSGMYVGKLGGDF